MRSVANQQIDPKTLQLFREVYGWNQEKLVERVFQEIEQNPDWILTDVMDVVDMIITSLTPMRPSSPEN